MNALFEDGGKFHAGRVMSETDASLQIELGFRQARQGQGRQRAAPLRRRPSPRRCSARPSDGARDRPRPGVGIRARGRVRLRRAGARLLRRQGRRDAGRPRRCSRLFGAPHYFRRLGKGRFRKAPEEIVKAALLGIERKRQIALQVDAWAAELVAGTCPAPIREQLYRILFKPDKNAPEYKAVVEAARRSERAPLDLLKAAGAIDSPYEFHWRRFLFEEFPKGVGFADAPVPTIREKLALSPAAGVLDRRLGDDRDRRRALGAGPRHRPGHVRHPHRRAGARGRARLARSRRSRATACRRSTSRATS